MTSRSERFMPYFHSNLRRKAFVLAIVCLVAIATRPAPAQTLTVLHQFTAGRDGAGPMTGLTEDAAGNLYGTTEFGGSQNCPEGCGTVFRLSQRNGHWIFTTLYSFQGGSDSAYPVARVVFGPDGALYGTASGTNFNYGLCTEGCGEVFRLRPPATFCASVSCPWTKTTLYSFPGYPDGIIPQGGDLVWDQDGNIYGTTLLGGSLNEGTVFELTPSNGGWTESMLYSFTGGTDGKQPYGGVVLDSAGNLYGTTLYGGNLNASYGVIFELSPPGSGWTETVLHVFAGGTDGALPYAGLTMDGAGNFYGTTYAGGDQPCNAGYSGCGTVFENGATIYAFTHQVINDELTGPLAPVTLDAQGNIYGTTIRDGANGYGNVFELSAGQHAYTSLYDFTDLNTGGFYPASNVTLDSSGVMYGTASQGGQYGVGIVWELTP